MNTITTIMIAMVAVMMMIGSASAVITQFNVTATDSTVAGATSSYTMQLNTSGFHSLDVTLPAGFEAVVPTTGQLTH